MNFARFIQDAVPMVLPDSVPTPKAELGMLKNMPLDELINRAVSGIVTLAINVAIAILVFYLGKFIINKLYNLVHNILLRRQVDSSLASFTLSFVRIVLYFILIVTVIGILGIETSSFLAIFASAGVAIGMALSGTLQNFAGGVLILLLKPYRVGDYIEAQGYAGTVKEIQIFHTLILTPDNKSITIPNGGLSTGSINNWSREAYRRVDWTVGISYGDSVEDARKAILDILYADPRVVNQTSDCTDEDQPSDETADDCAPEEPEKPGRSLFHLFRSHKRQLEQRRIQRQKQIKDLLPKPDRSPSVVLNNLADSAVELKVRAWTHTADYWSVYFSVLETIYNNLPSAGISFPFPQLDVHLGQEDSPSSHEKIKKSQYDKQVELSSPHHRGAQT